MRQIEENKIGSVPPPLDDTNTAEQGQRLSTIDLLILVLRRKWFIVKISLAFAIVGVIVALLLPVRYTAEAVIIPPQQNQSTGSLLLSQLGSLGGLGSLASGSLGLKNQTDMYVSMLKSRSVEDALVKKFDLMKLYRAKRSSDARKMLENYSTINSGSKDGLIHISVEDRDPNRAADMANAYVSEFRSLNSSLALSEASQRRQFFQDQLVSAKESLGNAEEALKQTEQKTGLVQVDSQARALVQSAASLRAEIAAKQVQLQTMNSFATTENPQVQIIRHQIDALQEQLKKLGGTDKGSDVDMISLRGKISQEGLEYLRKMRDVRYYETIFELLSRQFEIAKLDEARDGIVQVVDPAVPPDHKSFPQRTIIVLICLLLGGLLAVAYVLASEWSALADPEERQKLVQLRRTLWRAS